jgi:hypothetical protein
LSEPPKILPDGAGIHTRTVSGDILIASDSIDDHPLRFSIHPHIVEVVSVPPDVAVPDDPVVDYRCCVIVVDDGRSVDVRDPDPVVVVDTEDVALIDYHRVTDIGATIPIAEIDAKTRETGSCHYDGSGKPGAMTIVRFPRRQWKPSHLRIRMDPAHSARVPAAATSVSRSHMDSSDRPGPIPAPAVIDVDPVSVMVSHITEGFLGNPTLIAVPFRPSSLGKGRPVLADICRPPHLTILSFVLNPFPPAILVQNRSLILQIRRQVSHRLSFYLQSLGPEFVPV